MLGARIWNFGERPRMANVVKAAVNYNIIHAIQALGESVALVEAHGVDGGEFVELLTNSLFGGVAYTVYGGDIADDAHAARLHDVARVQGSRPRRGGRGRGRRRRCRPRPCCTRCSRRRSPPTT